MKRAIILILCIAMSINLCGCGKGKQVEAAEAAIEAIGDVTLKSGEAIEAAKTAFDALKPEQQEKVENYTVLTDAEEEYDYLTFTAANQPFSYKWINSADGDIYIFECTGEGTHDNVPCTYTLTEDNTGIVVSEDGVEEDIILQLNVAERTELVTKGKRYPYVQQQDYEAAGAEVRTEVEKYLTSPDGIWVLGDWFMHFSENGIGLVYETFGDFTNSKYSYLSWEYIDNDTIKIQWSPYTFTGNYFYTGDFVLRNGTQPLLLTPGKENEGGMYISWEDLVNGSSN